MMKLKSDIQIEEAKLIDMKTGEVIGACQPITIPTLKSSYYEAIKSKAVKENG